MTYEKQTVSAKIAAASAAFQQGRIDWITVDYLFGGTSAMRAAGSLFLPKEPLETEADWENRVQRSWLDNYYKQAVDAATAKVLSKDILIENAPINIQLFTDDVDSQQRNMTQFSKDVFRDAVNHGISYILVDYPHVPMDSPFPNRAAELAAGNRPYWVNVSCSDVLIARSARIEGSEQLSLFRFQETVTEMDDDGVTERVILQVREYSQIPDPMTGKVGPVEWKIYRVDPHEQGRYLVWQQGIINAVSRIPVAPVYTNKTGFYLGRPPLMELAELNCSHWAQNSDLNNIIHIVTVPFLLAQGLAQMDANGKVQKFEINIHSAINTPNTEAKVGWIEHTGAAVKSAQEHLDRLVDRMNQLTCQFTTSASGSMTATQSAINAAEANSDLKSMALGLQDAINIALYFTAQYLGETSYGRASVNTSFSVDYVSVDTFAQVQAMYDAGAIDWNTLMAEAKRRNIVDSAIQLKSQPAPAIQQALPLQIGNNQTPTAN